MLLAPRETLKIRTGIAVEARDPQTGAPLGLLVRDRSSMAARGLATTGGVIDAGYRGEILIVMTNLGDKEVELKAGEKIAQMVPVPVLTGPVEEVASLEDSIRAAEGLRQLGHLTAIPGTNGAMRDPSGALPRPEPQLPYCVSLSQIMERIMPFSEAFKLALQSLWANKLRSILTLIGVVMGVASVIMVITLVNGANRYVSTKISGYGADVLHVIAHAERDFQLPGLLPLPEAQDHPHGGLPGGARRMRAMQRSGRDAAEINQCGL